MEYKRNYANEFELELMLGSKKEWKLLWKAIRWAHSSKERTNTG